MRTCSLKILLLSFGVACMGCNDGRSSNVVDYDAADTTDVGTDTSTDTGVNFADTRMGDADVEDPNPDTTDAPMDVVDANNATDARVDVVEIGLDTADVADASVDANDIGSDAFDAPDNSDTSVDVADTGTDVGADIIDEEVTIVEPFVTMGTLGPPEVYDGIYAFASLAPIRVGQWGFTPHGADMQLREMCFIIWPTPDRDVNGIIERYIDSFTLYEDAHGTPVRVGSPSSDGTWCMENLRVNVSAEDTISPSLGVNFNHRAQMDHPGSQFYVLPTRATFLILGSDEEIVLDRLEVSSVDDEYDGRYGYPYWSLSGWVLLQDTYPADLHLNGGETPLVAGLNRELFEVTMSHQWRCTSRVRDCGGVEQIYVEVSTSDGSDLFGAEDARIRDFEVFSEGSRLEDAVAYVHPSGLGLVIELPEGFLRFDDPVPSVAQFSVHAFVERFDEGDVIAFRIPREGLVDSGSRVRRYVGPGFYGSDPVIWPLVYRNGEEWFGGSLLPWLPSEDIIFRY